MGALRPRRARHPPTRERVASNDSSAPDPAAAPDDAKFERDLSRLGAFISQVPRAFQMSAADDLAQPNTVRHWSAMTGGAAFTEPGIHYLRGSWSLAPDECLVLGRSAWWRADTGTSCCTADSSIPSTTAAARSRGPPRTPMSWTGAFGSRSPVAIRASEAHDWLDTEGRCVRDLRDAFSCSPIPNPPSPTFASSSLNTP